MSKTQIARENGKPARNKANVQERADWQKGIGLPGNQKPSNDNFPKHTCNGKKNRNKGNIKP